ncbi:hypothetical protein F2Q69_00007369 [Brassica cretica]|uniref:Uncharacterized protein n=1 Tax=Brassica cretica TaxID=69181 RepID=A0A8S9PBB0_BRACR|nr:hypothetical protein F2Q69_00007369 [Brassica cretica]
MKLRLDQPVKLHLDQPVKLRLDPLVKTTSRSAGEVNGISPTSGLWVQEDRGRAEDLIGAAMAISAMLESRSLLLTYEHVSPQALSLSLSLRLHLVVSEIPLSSMLVVGENAFLYSASSSKSALLDRHVSSLITCRTQHVFNPETTRPKP